MRYKKLLDHVKPKILSKTSTYRGLMLNEETGAIFPMSSWELKDATKEKRPYNEHTVSFYFMPGDICILNKVPLATYDLVPFGMTGKFKTRQSQKSEYTYIHELFDKYESFDGMKVSMIDGKPIDARLLDDIEFNAKPLAQFEERLEELRQAFFVLNRMADKDFKSIHACYDIDANEKRRVLLLKLFSKPLSSIDKWPEKLEPFYARFYRNAEGYQSQNDPHNHKKVFDNMIRFDRAWLFRQLKIVT